MLNPVICPQCFQPNEPARTHCWKCLRGLGAPPTEADYLRLFELKTSWRQEDLKTSFRRLAKKYHPDANPGNREADACFKFINHAYEALAKVTPESGPAPQKQFNPNNPPGREEMASDELYEKLLDVVYDSYYSNQPVIKLTRFQKLKKWFQGLWK